MLLLSSFCLCSCKQKSKNPSSPTEYTHSPKSISLIDPIDGAQLKIDNLEAKDVVVGGIHLLEINLQEDPLANYYQFAICTKDNAKCEPSKDSPGEFVSSPFVYPSAPAGDLVLEVRACVRSYNALTNGKTCNDWQSVSFRQEANSDSTAYTLIKKMYATQVNIMQDAYYIWALYTSYNNAVSNSSVVTDSPAILELQRMAQNAENLGQDVLSQMILSDSFLHAYNTISSLTLPKEENVTIGLNLEMAPVDTKSTAPEVTIHGHDVIRQSTQGLIQTLTHTPPIPTAQLMMKAALFGLRSIVLQEAKRQALNAELRKSATYTTLRKILPPYEPSDEKLFAEGKITREEFDRRREKGKNSPISSKDLTALIHENPEVVIRSANVKLEVLEMAEKGLVGVDLLNYNKLKKLQAIPEAQRKDIQKTNLADLQKKLESKGIVDADGKLTKPAIIEANIEKSLANSVVETRKIAAIQLPEIFQRPTVRSPINPEVKATESKINPREKAGSAKTAAGTVLIAAAIGAMRLNENSTSDPNYNVVMGIDIVFRQLIEDRLQFVFLQEQLGQELLKLKN
jgi:hypothetical protein